MDSSLVAFLRHFSFQARSLSLGLGGLVSLLVLTGCPPQSNNPGSSSPTTTRKQPAPVVRRAKPAPRSRASQVTPPPLRRVRIISMTPVTRRGAVPPVAVGPQPPRRSKLSRTIPPKGPQASMVPRRAAPKINPKTLFYPIPFPLPLDEAEKRYRKFYAEAKAMKIGARETFFLKQLWKERTREGKYRSYRNQMVRLSGQRYLRISGLKKYQLMGYRELMRFEALLDQFLKLPGSPLQVRTGPTKHAAISQKMAAIAGFYPMLLKQIGVTATTKKLSRIQRYWLRTLFFARWGLQAWGMFPLPVMLGNGVYKDYLKARILWTAGFQKRLFAVRESRKLDPKFPVFRVLGWLFIQTGRIRSAKASLKDAVTRDPKDKHSRSLLDKISRPPT